MRRSSSTVFAMVVTASSLLLAGCGSPSSRTPLPSSSVTSPAGQPGSNLSIPTPTPLPLPSRAEMKRRFEAELSPLVQELLDASEDSAAFVSAGDELVYIPQTERVYAVQTILGYTHTASSGGGKRVYILYDVSRGDDLGPDSGAGNLRTTQAVITSLRLVVESDDEFGLIEKEDGTGGEGSSSYQDMVGRSVPPLAKLPAALQGRVERELEEIIGYACGLDMRGDLAESTRAAALIQTLDSSDWADKRQGLEALANLTYLPPSLAPILLAQLNDERSSYEVVQVLAKMGVDPAVFNEAMEAARSSDPSTRTSAAALLGGIPGQQAIAVPILMELLRDPDDRVRFEAAWQLGSNNAPYMAPLGSDDAPSVVQLLSTALDDPDETYRLAVLDALGYMLEAAAPAVPKLVAALPGSSPAVRRSICGVLGIIGEAARDAVPALEQAIRQETDPETFEAEANALLEIAGKDAIPPLLRETLASPQAEIRRRTLTLFGWEFAKVPGVLSLVASALGDTDESIRSEAVDVIASILGERSKDEIPGWPGEEERSIIPALFQVLRDSPDFRTKAQAGLALTTLNATHAVELDQAIQSEDLVVISMVYRLYIERGEAGTEAVLIKALNQHGTEQMATDFLNCGNSLLDAAATEWAKKHRYTMYTAPSGSGDPRWGSGQ